MLSASKFSTGLLNVTAKVQNTQVQDAISALIALGYKPNEANQAIHKLNNMNQAAKY